MSLIVTLKKTGSYKIQGRQGRYEGLSVWETKQCVDCECRRPAICLERDIMGVCTKGVAWKVIVKNPKERRIRKCQVIRVDRREIRS